MNLEENRLNSFDSWPQNAPVGPQLLARSGFFASGRFLEAECHWCQCRISDWQYEDQVEVRHRNEKPMCPFLVNKEACGNVPLSHCEEEQTSAHSSPACATQHKNLDLLNEGYRLATFKNWPNPNISPQSLAKAGFYYLNRSDQVKCAWCKGVMAEWEKSDNAFEEHKRYFPDCPRVQLGPHIEIASEGDLGIQQISPPKKPKFSSLDARLRTYANWPISDIQRPEALAQAGLYYKNVDDHVRCFHCNIGLRSWQKEDDPWFEHAKWYPQCQFVRLVMGVMYVERVQELTKQSTQNQSSAASQMTIDEAMNTAPVRQALEMGIDGGAVRNVTQLQLAATGRPYDTVDDILKAVFGEPNDSDQSVGEPEDSLGSSDGAGASIVREVSRIINNIFNTSGVGCNVPNSSSSFGDELCRGNLLYSSPDISTENTYETAALTSTHPPSEQNIVTAGAVEKDVPAVQTLVKEDVALPMLSNQNSEQSSIRNLSLEEENRQLKDARLCKVCLDEEVAVVFLPCGHLVTCVQCAPGVHQCPMCRTAIKGFVRTFLS